MLIRQHVRFQKTYALHSTLIYTISHVIIILLYYGLKYVYIRVGQCNLDMFTSEHNKTLNKLLLMYVTCVPERWKAYICVWQIQGVCVYEKQ